MICEEKNMVGNFAFPSLIKYFEELSAIPRASYNEDGVAEYLCNFAKTGNPNKGGELPTWIASGKGQNRVLILGEKDTHMGKPNLLKMICTMLTTKPVGE